jgi:hypothetical protein
MYIYLFQKNIQIPKYNDISSMYQIVKVRSVNRSRFLAIPKELVERIQAEYMAVKLDESGRLIYMPISEAV